MSKEIPYFPRRPVETPEQPDQYHLLRAEDSLDAIVRSGLSQGSRELAAALLLYAQPQRFPGGLGLNYQDLFKLVFFPQYSWAAIQEMAAQIKGKVDAILMPERSGVVPGCQFMVALGNIPVLRLEKNGDAQNAVCAVEVDSYTGGDRDIMFLQPGPLQQLMRHFSSRPVRLLLADEITDTGGMFRAVTAAGGIKDQCQAAGLAIEVVAAATLMEKTYTGARGDLEALGLEVFSGVQIVDIWERSRFGPGIKLAGIDYGLTFSQGQ